MMRMRALHVGFAIALAFSAGALAQSFGTEPPSAIMELRASSFTGAPSQLSWSPDSTTLALQTLEGESAPLKARWYLIHLTDHQLQGVDGPPEWATTYWNWKSARTPPGRPTMVIQVETQHQAGLIPSQSLRDKAANRGIDNAVAARNAASGSVVRILTLNGEAIGRYVDEPLVPGTTFGWSPERLHAVAFVRTDGRLGAMDLDGDKGDKVDVQTGKGVRLPAWSPDGSRIVYLQQKGQRDYDLMQIVVLHL
jgi:WD40-like Beta Propeller Repeat